MKIETRESDLEIVRRYTDQPAHMPRELRHAIEARFGGEPVQLYALADLDAGLRLARTWLALGPEQLAVVRQPQADGPPEVSSFERARVREVRHTPGLSCNALAILAGPDEPPLALLRYSHRQRKAMENISFVLEQALEGQQVHESDADAEYVESMARPIRDAQALIARRRHAVLWRLLAYLRPYRRDVAIGMSAATVLTLCALAPPYITGYLIDSVIEPAQSGQLDLERATLIGWICIAAMGAIYLLRQLCNWVRLRLMTVLGEYVARDLRTELYEHLQELSLSFFARKKTGSLITRVSADTDRLWEFLALGVASAQ